MGNDTGLVWKNLKDWFGWKQHGLSTQLSHCRNIYTKPADLSRIMNEQFIDKVNNHVDNLSPPISDPIAPVENFMKFKTCSLELNTVHPDQVEKILMNMRSSSSCGLDTINMKLLKLGKDQLLPAITHIINLSIRQQCFPEAWKVAKAVPLHKNNLKQAQKTIRQ